MYFSRKAVSCCEILAIKVSISRFTKCIKPKRSGTLDSFTYSASSMARLYFANQRYTHLRHIEALTVAMTGPTVPLNDPITCRTQLADASTVPNRMHVPDSSSAVVSTGST